MSMSSRIILHRSFHTSFSPLVYSRVHCSNFSVFPAAFLFNRVWYVYVWTYVCMHAHIHVCRVCRGCCASSFYPPESGSLIEPGAELFLFSSARLPVSKPQQPSCLRIVPIPQSGATGGATPTLDVGAKDTSPGVLVCATRAPLCRVVSPVPFLFVIPFFLDQFGRILNWRNLLI